MNQTERIRMELEGSGYPTQVFEWNQGTVIAFEYQMECGSHAGKTVHIGVSNPDGEYPEYPPHWVHISPPLDDGRGGAKEIYQDPEGRQWLAMSRPPSDFWDRRPTKHMSVYVKEHIGRIWKDV